MSIGDFNDDDRPVTITPELDLDAIRANPIRMAAVPTILALCDEVERLREEKSSESK